MNDKLRQAEYRRYYDESDYYDRCGNGLGTRDTAFNRYARRYIFSIYYPRKGDRIVEFGCGWGRISLFLQDQGFDVYSVDYSIKSVEICRSGAEALGLDPERFLCADAAAAPFAEESFDVLYTAGLVEHLFPEVFLEFVSEARRILKRGGKFIIGTPNPHHFLEVMKRNEILLKKDISHVDYKTMSRLKRTLCENGFHIERAFYYPSHLPFVRWVERSTMAFLPFMRRRNCLLAIRQE